jgi:hypothetical protein
VIEPGWRFTLDEYTNGLIEFRAQPEAKAAEAAVAQA